MCLKWRFFCFVLEPGNSIGLNGTGRGGGYFFFAVGVSNNKKRHSRHAPGFSRRCFLLLSDVSEVRSTRFPLIKNRAYQPRGEIVLAQFGHAGFVFDVHFSRFGCFLVLSARNGVLAREIVPSE